MINALFGYVKKAFSLLGENAVFGLKWRQIAQIFAEGMQFATRPEFEEWFFFENQLRTGGINMKFKLMMMTSALASLALAACSTTTPNVSTNANTRNTTVNSNQAVVVPSNTNPTTNTNRWNNANVNREDYNKDRAQYEKDKRSGETIGQGANDSWLWFKTRAALMTTSDLRESTIDVDVVNDVVTLKGTVETAAQKTKAGQVAKDIDGVKDVKNELKVAPKDSMTNQMVNGTGDTKSNSKTNK